MLRQADNGDGCVGFCRHHDKALFLTGILMQIEVAMPVLKKSSLKCWERQEGTCLQTA